MPEIEVRKLFKEGKKKIKLELLSGEDGLDRKISVCEINRPGLALTGYFDDFPFERLQVLGNGEMSYLRKLSQGKRKQVLEKVLSYNIPCFVITRNLVSPQELIDVSRKKKIALFRTSLLTSKFISKITAYLEDKFALRTTILGVLVEVYGMGVLILGKSGIGKSECALGLVKKGHRLIADDVVDITRKTGQFLVGTGNELIRHHMEVRGMGIINVATLFGIGAVKDVNSIELIVRLEEWRENKVYDRVGLDEKLVSILGVRLPELLIPVRPGRNTAMIIEVAAMNQRLKNEGRHSAYELNKRLIREMKLKRDKKSEN
ncbi:HPr(Ser) kinase/phosphatase [bacterium]|nr:HPr(Ser) kinase/phosphatase [bacterium]